MSSDQIVFQTQRKSDRSDPYWVNAVGDLCIVDKCMTDDNGNLASLILRYTAEVVDLKAKTSQKENYYKSLFKGCLVRK